MHFFAHAHIISLGRTGREEEFVTQHAHWSRHLLVFSPRLVLLGNLAVDLSEYVHEVVGLRLVVHGLGEGLDEPGPKGGVTPGDVPRGGGVGEYEVGFVRQRLVESATVRLVLV